MWLLFSVLFYVELVLELGFNCRWCRMAVGQSRVHAACVEATWTVNGQSVVCVRWFFAVVAPSVCLAVASCAVPVLFLSRPPLVLRSFPFCAVRSLLPPIPSASGRPFPLIPSLVAFCFCRPFPATPHGSSAQQIHRSELWAGWPLLGGTTRAKSRSPCLRLARPGPLQSTALFGAVRLRAHYAYAFSSVFTGRALFPRRPRSLEPTLDCGQASVRPPSITAAGPRPAAWRPALSPRRPSRVPPFPHSISPCSPSAAPPVCSRVFLLDWGPWAR